MSDHILEMGGLLFNKKILLKVGCLKRIPQIFSKFKDDSNRLKFSGLFIIGQKQRSQVYQWSEILKLYLIIKKNYFISSSLSFCFNCIKALKSF